MNRWMLKSYRTTQSYSMQGKVCKTTWMEPCRRTRLKEGPAMPCKTKAMRCMGLSAAVHLNMGNT